MAGKKTGKSGRGWTAEQHFLLQDAPKGKGELMELSEMLQKPQSEVTSEWDKIKKWPEWTPDQDERLREEKRKNARAQFSKIAKLTDHDEDDVRARWHRLRDMETRGNSGRSSSRPAETRAESSSSGKGKAIEKDSDTAMKDADEQSDGAADDDHLTEDNDRSDSDDHQSDADDDQSESDVGPSDSDNGHSDSDGDRSDPDDDGSDTESDQSGSDDGSSDDSLKKAKKELASKPGYLASIPRHLEKTPVRHDVGYQDPYPDAVPRKPMFWVTYQMKRFVIVCVGWPKKNICYWTLWEEADVKHLLGNFKFDESTSLTGQTRLGLFRDNKAGKLKYGKSALSNFGSIAFHNFNGAIEDVGRIDPNARNRPRQGERMPLTYCIHTLWHTERGTLVSPASRSEIRARRGQKGADLAIYERAVEEITRFEEKHHLCLGKAGPKGKGAERTRKDEGRKEGRGKKDESAEERKDGRGQKDEEARERGERKKNGSGRRERRKKSDRPKGEEGGKKDDKTKGKERRKQTREGKA